MSGRHDIPACSINYYQNVTVIVIIIITTTSCIVERHTIQRARHGSASQRDGGVGRSLNEDYDVALSLSSSKRRSLTVRGIKCRTGPWLRVASVAGQHVPGPRAVVVVVAHAPAAAAAAAGPKGLSDGRDGNNMSSSGRVALAPPRCPPAGLLRYPTPPPLSSQF